MVITVDEQVEVLSLVVSQEAFGSPHVLLLTCNGVRQDASGVMPAFAAKGSLQWTAFTSLLQKFPKAKRLSFYKQHDESLVTELVKGRDLHALSLYQCCGVRDVSALAGCASLHTLNLYRCGGVADVSALAGVRLLT